MADLLQKVVHVGPFQHVHLMNGAVYFYRHDEVGVVDGLWGDVESGGQLDGEARLLTLVSVAWRLNTEIKLDP